MERVTSLITGSAGIALSMATSAIPVDQLPGLISGITQLVIAIGTIIALFRKRKPKQVKP